MKLFLIGMIQKDHYDALHTAGGHLSGVTSMPDFSPALTVGLVTTAIYLVILLILAFRKFPEIGRIEDEAAGKPEPAP